MTDLERELRAYGTAVRFPAEAEVWPAIAGRLDEPPARRLRVAMVAIAALTAVGIAFAVPPARSAILRVLGLDGVSVIQVDELPTLDAAQAVDVGQRTTLESARAAVPFRLRLLEDREPTAIYIGRDEPPAVTIVYGALRRPRLMLTQFRPCCGQDWLTKEVPAGTRVERVDVGGKQGIWIGGEHVVRRGAAARIVGPTLLWQRGRVIFRLEAETSKDDALRLAESLISLPTGS